MSRTNAILQSELEKIRESGTWKNERVITSKQNVNINVEGQEKKLVNFCDNDYLGLSNHPTIVSAGIAALEKYGVGLSSARFICGTQSIHKQLERKIAEFHGREDAIVYGSGFDANAGLFQVLLGPNDAIISDELNHASVIDGIRMCKAQRHRFEHRNMTELESALVATRDARIRLIATDGVFSMDGTVTPLKEICDLADAYDALVFVDESHSAGVFGKTGRGTEEYFDMSRRVDIINSSMGKALGVAGGYTTSSREIVELLRQKSRPYLFSNSITPPIVACSMAAFDLIMNNSELADKLKTNMTRFRSKMTDAGFNTIGDDHPICPVMIYDAKLATVFADEMLKQGVYVIGLSYPVVPKGKARIRVQLSAAHSIDDIDKAIEAFIVVGKKLKVIK